MRGLCLAHCTRLSNHLKELEGEPGELRTGCHRHTLIDLIDDEATLAREQDVLETHDDLIAELTVCVKQVIGTSSLVASRSSRKIASRTITHMQKSLASIALIVSTTVLETCLLRQYEEKTNIICKDLAKTRDDLHHMELDEGDKLFELQDNLESQVYLPLHLAHQRLLVPHLKQRGEAGCSHI